MVTLQEKHKLLSRSVVLKVGGITLGDDFEGQVGKQNKGGDRGQNTTKGVKCSTTNQSLSSLQPTIIKLTSAVTSMLSKQKNAC